MWFLVCHFSGSFRRAGASFRCQDTPRYPQTPPSTTLQCKDSAGETKPPPRSFLATGALGSGSEAKAATQAKPPASGRRAPIDPGGRDDGRSRAGPGPMRDGPPGQLCQCCRYVHRRHRCRRDVPSTRQGFDMTRSETQKGQDPLPMAPGHARIGGRRDVCEDRRRRSVLVASRPARARQRRRVRPDLPPPEGRSPRPLVEGPTLRCLTASCGPRPPA
jgi:hypothetical protein